MQQQALPDRPPNADESYHTIEDIRWQLEHATSTSWHVDDAAFVDNPNHGGELPLNISMSHEIGATLECTAVDPWQTLAGKDVIRAHRITLESPTIDGSRYVVMSSDWGVQYINAASGESMDTDVRPTVSSSFDACRCLAAAALRVSRTVQSLESRFGSVANYRDGQAALTGF